MSSRTTSGVDLHLDLPPGRGARVALTDALRDAVRTGRLAPGARLPSSRSLAADLGLARNTVVDAYAELAAEGWLTARQGSATRVAPRAAARHAAVAAPAAPNTGRPVHDLVPGRPDVSSFPRAAWVRATRRALATAPDEAFGYGSPRGRIELRTALADYLARSRGVRAGPERIVVCAGAAHALTLLATVLNRRGVRTVAVEELGLHLHRDLLADAGLELRPVAVDEAGARTDTLDATSGAVLLTAAHQFPTGTALPPDRRAAVVDWARRTGGLVIEDDYDGELRYDRRPVGALQGLDPERVAYLGTVSKALAPGLRLGWMVLPARLVGDVMRAKGPVETTVGAVDQLTLAELVASGAYDRHVRARRRVYRRRRDELVAALATHAPGVRVGGLAAGLHAVLWLPPGTEPEVLRAAAWQGVALEPMSLFRHPDAAPPGDAVVVGYATPSESAWAGALQALCQAVARGIGA